jgi:multiple sugar transport system permease protein
MAHASGGTERFWRTVTVAPTVVIFLVLTALPIASLVMMSFHSLKWVQALPQWTYVGTRNFQALPQDQLFRDGIVNTLIFAAAAVTAQMILGFFLALASSKVARGTFIYRTIFVLPILVPGIIIGAIWKLMYNYDFGVINQVTGLLGMAPHNWLGEKATALLSVIVVDCWHWTPFCFLLLLAGLESQPVDVYEAAKVDGATAWGELCYVTIPLMLPTIIVTLIFRLIVAFKVFDEVFLLTGGGPGTATEVISFTIYRRFFTEDRVGHGSAISIITLLVISTLIILALGVARRRGREA